MSHRGNIVSRYAKRTVFANRGRSILTLIGIIVATMMFSIVASAYVCAIDILESFADDDYGKWHVEAYSTSSLDYQKTMKDQRLEEVAYVQEIGFNPGVDGMGQVILEGKYQYFVGAMSPNFQDLCNFHLVMGNMPQNEGEAIISLEMFADDRENMQIGSEISLETYARYSEGHKVMDLERLTRDRTGTVDEQIFLTGNYTFTIVGYYVVPEYATWKNIAENTILTVSDSITTGNAVNAYYHLSDPSSYRSFTKDYFEEENKCLYNKDYIRMENSADDTRTRNVFGIIVICTIAVIVLLAVMLIYNSFSTSSSERMRAIGLLKSVGATRKQVRQLMLKEAFYYSVIGIPIGVVLGQFASLILIRFLQGMSADAANYIITKDIDLTYRLGYQNLIGPVVLGVLTILIAVFIPTMKVSRVSPIEAVHANEHFEESRSMTLIGRLSARITEKIFGFAGGLSAKNFFRYRRRYRTTVISIVASIFMIVFANMLVRSVSEILIETDPDERPNAIEYVKNTDESGFSQKDRSLYYELAGVEGVKTSRMSFAMDMYMMLTKAETTETFQSFFLESDETVAGLSQIQMVFIDDSDWRELCAQYNIDAEPFLTYGSSMCLMNNQCLFYDESSQTSQMVDVYSLIPTLMDFPLQLLGSGYGRSELLSRMHLEPVAQVDWADELSMSRSYLQIYVPMSRLEYYELEGSPGVETFQFTAKDPRAAVADMKAILEKELYTTDHLTDTGIATRAARAVNNLMKIVLYGYVAMLSLMCFLNVIMTVIANIIFRRKEYILLMSVGMSRKTLFRMVIAESLIYFFESILLLVLIVGGALVISILLIDPFIYRYVRVGFTIITVLIHLLVVVITTACGLSSVMKDEIIEGIRKEYY